jgi:hypothetical protein
VLRRKVVIANDIEPIEGLVGHPEADEALGNLLAPVDLQELARDHADHHHRGGRRHQDRKQYRGFAQLIDRSLLDGVEEILGPVVERHLCDDVEQCQREGTDGEHPGAPRVRAPPEAFRKLCHGSKYVEYRHRRSPSPARSRHGANPRAPAQR